MQSRRAEEMEGGEGGGEEQEKGERWSEEEVKVVDSGAERRNWLGELGGKVGEKQEVEMRGEDGAEEGVRELMSFWVMVAAKSIKGVTRVVKRSRKGLVMAWRTQTEGQVRRMRVSIWGSDANSSLKHSSKRLMGSLS